MSVDGFKEAKMLKVAVVALLTIFTAFTFPVHAQDWYLNGRGPDTPYQIWRAGEDGLPDATGPALEPQGNIEHLAWPSAIREGKEVRLYVSAKSAGQWGMLRLYVSKDVSKFADQGTIFQANGDEPHGIGPAYVMRDPAGSHKYILYYLIRGEHGPGTHIGVATSSDGISWTRRGSVLTTSLPEEKGGLAPAYVCRTSSGNVVMLYHGYNSSLTHGASLIATAPTPISLFEHKKIIKKWDGWSTIFNGKAGEALGMVGLDGGNVPLAVPLLIHGNAQEPIVAIKQDRNRVWLDRPLLNNYADAKLYSMARRKVDMSYIEELADGSWKGIATLYGPAYGVAAEYTVSLTSPALEGPWTFDGTGLRFKPSLTAISLSFENPTPVTTDASCMD